MSTVHYIVLIDNENETYDTSLIMKTESVEEIDKKIVELKQELKKDQVLHTYYVYITKTDDNYDGYVINNISSVSKIAEAVKSDASYASVASDTSVKAVESVEPVESLLK